MAWRRSAAGRPPWKSGNRSDTLACAAVVVCGLAIVGPTGSVGSRGASATLPRKFWVISSEDRNPGKSARTGDIDIVTRCLGAFLRCDEVRIVFERYVHGSLDIGRKAGERWWRLQVIRRFADQGDIVFTRGYQICLSAPQIALRQRQTGLGLGNIGVQIADFEAVVGCLRIHGKHVDLVE